MKKLTFWKSLFLLCALIVGTSTSWATDFTLSSASSVTTDGITVSFAKGSGSTAPTWYGAGLRLYAKNTVTITCANNISGVEFNWEKQGDKAFASATASVGSYTHPSSAGKGTWSGSAKSITFTLGSSGQLQLNTLSVTLESATPSISASNVDIDDDATNGSIAYEISKPVTGGTLTAAIKTGTTPTIENFALGTVTSSAVPFTCDANTTSSARTATVTLTYTYNTSETVTKDVTVTQAATVTKYTVTIEPPANGTLVVTRGETTVNTGDKFPEGTVLNVTATANDGYKFRNWQAVDGSTHTYTASNTGTWTMTAHDVTLKANFDKKDEFTYSWMVNGTEVKSETLYEDDDVVFPAVADIGGKVFYGWVTTSTVNPNNAPSLVNTTGVKASANTTYYAVFADKEGDGVDTYEKITSSTFDTNEEYVIAAEQSSTVHTMRYLYSYQYVDKNSDWGKSTTTPATVSPIKFTFTGTASSFVAQDKDGKYLVPWKNNFRMETGTSKASISINASGVISGKSGGDGTTNVNLRYNYNNGSGGFRWYDGTTGTQAYFYKVIPGYNYSDFCTSVTVTLAPTKTYTTLTSAYALDFTTVSDDLKAFIAIEVDGDKVKMTQVNKVPANTGLVLKATTPNSAVNVPVFDGTGAEDVTGNKMVGSATETTAIEKDGGYILSNGVFQPANAGTLAAGKAYLQIAVTSARSLEMSFDDATTGIANLNVDDNFDTNAPMYNLAGQRVNKSYKGVVIVNGKKMLNK